MFNTTDRVCKLAYERNLSITKLCELSDVSRSTFTSTKQRRGQLSLDTIDRFCKALDITMSQFFEEGTN